MTTADVNFHRSQVLLSVSVGGDTENYVAFLYKKNSSDGVFVLGTLTPVHYSIKQY